MAAAGPGDASREFTATIVMLVSAWIGPTTHPVVSGPPAPGGSISEGVHGATGHSFKQQIQPHQMLTPLESSLLPDSTVSRSRHADHLLHVANGRVHRREACPCMDVGRRIRIRGNAMQASSAQCGQLWFRPIWFRTSFAMASLAAANPCNPYKAAYSYILHYCPNPDPATDEHPRKSERHPSSLHTADERPRPTCSITPGLSSAEVPVAMVSVVV